MNKVKVSLELAKMSVMEMVVFGNHVVTNIGASSYFATPTVTGSWIDADLGTKCNHHHRFNKRYALLFPPQGSSKNMSISVGWALQYNSTVK